ncbi:hypothetical protein CTAYLR_003020 [Chrysophaeum taylorii]|uniref:Short-chain dehydrogenase n=1 Tax=Chrysophaeum taylorii TaxID=2483200 RepID=A0AAD7U504_9STRA|nr:hypothetical protein CTAYLR_003020 [Chrysophaeum taylorii]
MSLQNKVICITGASTGIGAAAARYLAAEGASVVLGARSEAKICAIADELGGEGHRALAVPCDVSDAAQVKKFLEAATTAFGKIDVLVNNAGRIDPVARIEESDVDEWSKTVDVNLKGVYYGMRYAADHMTEGGTIINISSGAATSALEGWSHYCATKAAVLMLTKCGHKELGPKKKIRVVGLSPGTVATDMQTVIKASGINPVSKLDWSKHIPPEYVAKAVAFLAGPGADPYLGTDFSLKTNEGRAAVGLPPL